MAWYSAIQKQYWASVEVWKNTVMEAAAVNRKANWASYRMQDRNEYRPERGHALQLGSKGNNGSFQNCVIPR